jgi:uncharacterized membrane protein
MLPSSSVQVSAPTQERAKLRSTSRLLGEIVVLGTLLRLIALGHKSFWLDEIASVVIARLPGEHFWRWLAHEEGNMALYYVLLRPWLHLGTGEAVVRVLSVIPGVASIPLMYLLGERLFQKSTGMLAALFLALNTCAIVYSQEARGYSLLVLGTLASTYLFVRLVEAPSFGIACGYGVVAAATLYCHYFGALVVLAHAVSLVFVRGQRRLWTSLLVAAAIIAVLSAPIVWLIRSQDPGHLNWVAPPSLLELYHLGVFLAAESGKGVGAVLLVLDLLLVGLFFVAFRDVWRSEAQGLQRWRYGLVASCAFTPVLASLLLSAVKPMFFHRFLIICLPAWILMTTVGAQRIPEHRRRLAVISAVCVLSIVSTVISYTRVREDWRGVAHYLMEHAAPQDRVLYYEPIGYFATENYRDWLPGGRVSRPVAVMENPASSDWQQKIAGAQRVWLVTYPAKLNDATTSEIKAELQKRLALSEQKQFRAITVSEYRGR